MGILYRSKHEMICVFKSSQASRIDSVKLGRHGRYRTTVWDYAGVNTFRKCRAADLGDHPTAKPTAMIADAIKDVTYRCDIVLNPFGGSGSTLLAAEKTGRRAGLIELDLLYIGVAIRRWEADATSPRRSSFVAKFDPEQCCWLVTGLMTVQDPHMKWRVPC